jgi:hypothetical protein
MVHILIMLMLKVKRALLLGGILMLRDFKPWLVNMV